MLHAGLVLSFLLGADVHLFSVDAGKSQIGFTLVHKMHTVKGAAKKGVEGKAKLSDNGAQIAVRVPVANFDSDNGNRDQHMMEVIESAKFPTVDIKALSEAKIPATFPSKVDVPLKGQVTFHGVTQPIEMTLTLEWASSKAVRATGKFAISLDAHKVERPSLMFVKVDDKVDIEVDISLTE